jgi:hypothetical protein
VWILNTLAVKHGDDMAGDGMGALSALLIGSAGWVMATRRRRLA